jgi:predicted porin
MKKSILALAVLNGLAGTALAQSNVTVYGLVDLGLVRETGGPAGNFTKMNSGIANGSRVGFKGTEDLGGGWNAFFDLQNGFQADTGVLGQGGLLFGRQAFVGMSGPLGTIKMGRQYSPVDDLIGATDPFGNGYAGRLQNVFVKGYLARVDNDVMYSTPTINGFSANIATGLGEVASKPSANRFVGGSFGYAAGPLFVRIAHNERNDMVVTASPNTAFGNATSDQNTMLGATYDFGVVKLHGAYGVTKTKNVGTTLVDADDALVGVSIPFGASKVMASYIRRNDKSANNRDANQIAVGYNYFLSKRTTLYAAYARIDNKNGAMFYTAGSSVDNGTGDKALDLGIRHTF